ncbi:MAG: hypothetical protein ACRDYA_23955 [Egibacteraceae bacterium]
MQYYALNYSAFPPGLLAGEVHRCRALITGMLGHTQPDTARIDLRRLAGWLSALLGNLAFHLSDYPAAWIHLGTAARLGADVGDARLVCWSLGTQSMVARYQHRYPDALDLARQGLEHTSTPLTRAQLLAWAELPALARLGTAHDPTPSWYSPLLAASWTPTPKASSRAGSGSTSPSSSSTSLRLTSCSTTPPARPSTRSRRWHTPRWAGPAGRPPPSCSPAARPTGIIPTKPPSSRSQSWTVLDTIPPQALRETARQRLTVLDGTLGAFDQPGPAAPDLHERLRILPSLATQPQHGPEPNGDS